MLKDEFIINLSNNIGNTHLMAASLHSHMNVVSYLVEKGAIVDKKNKDGFTALFGALKGDHLDLARLLLERGVDPNVQPYDTNNVFPLYAMAQANQPEACELLLRFGANLDQKMADDWTSLDIAIQENSTEAIMVLQAATDEKKEDLKKVNVIALAAADKIAAELIADLDNEANAAKAADNKKDKNKKVKKERKATAKKAAALQKDEEEKRIVAEVAKAREARMEAAATAKRVEEEKKNAAERTRSRLAAEKKAKIERLKEEKAQRVEAANRRFDERQEAKRVSLELEQQKLREEQEFEEELLVQQRILDEAAENKRKMGRLKEAARFAEQTRRFEAEQIAIADQLNLERLALEESSRFASLVASSSSSSSSPPPPQTSIDDKYAALERRMAVELASRDAEMAALKNPTFLN